MSNLHAKAITLKPNYGNRPDPTISLTNKKL